MRHAGRRRRKRLVQAARDERRVAGDAEHRRAAEACGPVEAGEDAGERPFPLKRTVRQDRPPEGREAGRFAVGADRDIRQIGGQRVEDAGEHRTTANVEQWLVAAAYAPSRSAGQDQAGDARHAGVKVTPDLGRAMGLEPTASKTTTWRSTI